MKISLTQDEKGIEFYTIPNLKEVQLLLLELLQIVDTVARNNNIKYWIDGGTLIGAVRHQGFIPWDDDIDLCLMKDDYDKFLPLLNRYIKDRQDLSLLFYNNQANHYWFEYFASTKIRVEHNGMKWPVRIDIIPMKLIENNKAAISNDSYFNDLAFYFVKGKVKYYPEILKKYNFNSLTDALNEKKNFFIRFESHLKSNFDIEDKTGMLVDYSFGDIYVNKKRAYKKYTDIFPLREISFAGIKVLCPNNTDNYLKVLYNNYMSLPPLEKRKQLHNSKILMGKESVTTNEIDRLIKEQNELFYYADKLSYKLVVFFRQLKSNGFSNVYYELIKPFILRKIKKSFK